MHKKKVLSGIQPTGRLHLGNLFGALNNWIKLQDEYESYFFIADYHALTTTYDDVTDLAKIIKEATMDLLSVGLDPEKCCIFRQSDILEHAELHLLLSMITPLSWLERVPSYKSKMEELEGKDLHTYGFLGYPLLQAADILLYEADFVPVGQDQLPHLEITREIARRFNHLYKGDVLKPPADLLTKIPVLLGTDGRKMSKSYNNTIAIADKPADINKKISAMITDPARVKRDDPGHPDVCTIFEYHKLFNEKEEQSIRADCEQAKIGCVQCKKKIAEILCDYLEPIRTKREELEKNPELIAQVLKSGAERAKKVAENTMHKVKKKMNID